MKDHYEKILLGVAALVAIVMATLGFVKLGAMEKDFPTANESRKSALPIEGETFITSAVDTLSKPLVLQPVKTAKGREVKSFTGINLFVRKGSSLTETVDPEAPGSAPIHPPIPNTWWLENGLSEAMGFGDGPQVDSDGDGFSNLEEFHAKSDPNNKNSFPSLFAKLKVASIEKNDWYLRFSNFGGGALSFRIEGFIAGKKVENRMKGGVSIPAGETFFKEGAFGQRFKFIELVQEERNGIPRDVARVEDLKPGKGNRVYDIPAGSHKTFQSDYVARLYLDTPQTVGDKFPIEEGMSFSLPFDAEATEKPYTLREIGNGGTTALIHWVNDGESKELEIKVDK